MSASPERLFLFVQCELPWTLGPPDGRYLLRSETNGEPERVIVLKTLAGRRAAEPVRALGAPGIFTRRASRRRREAPPEPEPSPVPVARATIVDPVSVSAERQARAWLAELDPEREIPAAFAVLNRLLYCYRLAAADPYAHEVDPAQALAIRAGWGEGEQVADGMWLFAQELPYSDAGGHGGPRGSGERGSPGGVGGHSAHSGSGADGNPCDRSSTTRSHRRPSRARAAALRPDEHLAELLSARERPLLCEEFVLRARLDLDQGRTALAAIELDSALAAAARELAEEQSVDLSERVAELRDLHSDVERMAQAALGAQTALRSGSSASGAEPLHHALERLEAALRARGAAGYGRP